MISFDSFTDEFVKLAEGGGYRKPTTWERFMMPEGYMGEAIPLDPQERSDLYKKKTRFLPAIETGLMGALGGMLGYSAREKPMHAALGAGAGALVGGLGSLGLRHLVAKQVAQRAREEALTRGM